MADTDREILRLYFRQGIYGIETISDCTSQN